MMAVALALLWAAMVMAGRTPIGRAMRRWLVEAPARQLGRIHRGTVITMLLLAAMLGAIALLLEGDAFRFAAMATPEVASWIAMFEVSAWADAIALAVITASTVRWRAVAGWVKAQIVRKPRPRARRSRNIARRERPSNDDGEAGGLRWAA